MDAHSTHAPDAVSPVSHAGLQGEGKGAVPEEDQALLERTSLTISGMHCAACSGRIERIMAKQANVLEASVNLALEKAVITGHGLDVGHLIGLVEGAGFGAKEMPRGGQAKRDAEKAQEAAQALADRRTVQLFALSALFTLPLLAPMVLMLFGVPFHWPVWIEVLLATPVQILAGQRFYRGAYGAVRTGGSNMDVLVAIGTSAAYLYSLYLVLAEGSAVQGQLYFEASASVLTLVLLGKVLETRARRSTAQALRDLASLRPDMARVRTTAGWQDMPLESLTEGDVVLVRAGERLPVDGRVLKGASDVDEAMLTGESMPVFKDIGATVTAGTTNGAGILEVEAMALGEATLLARIISQVDDAQASKAPVQALVDQVTQIFVPVVLVLALVTLLGWLAFGAGFEAALIASVSVLVIACPCALGLATPTALVAGLGMAARRGVLIRDKEALAHGEHLDVIYFDKTGTLTLGKPRVVDVVPLVGQDQNDVVRLAAALQVASEHPLGKALLVEADRRDLTMPEVEAPDILPGGGLSGMVGDHRVLVGTARMLATHGIDTRAHEAALQSARRAARTLSYVAAGDELLGVIAFEDEVRETSAETIRLLEARGIRTIMLSGDRPEVAEALARQLGMSGGQGGLRPEDKLAVLQAARTDGQHIAMVGDGINDAPALAAADLGIAMGSGTDVAMGLAGVTLMRPDTRLVPLSLTILKRINSKIRQNLFWAFIYNVIGLPLAALGYLSPALAGAAMAMSSVSVVLNALTLRRGGDVDTLS